MKDDFPARIQSDRVLVQSFLEKHEPILQSELSKIQYDVGSQIKASKRLNHVGLLSRAIVDGRQVLKYLDLAVDAYDSGNYSQSIHFAYVAGKHIQRLATWTEDIENTLRIGNLVTLSNLPRPNFEAPQELKDRVKVDALQIRAKDPSLKPKRIADEIYKKDSTLHKYSSSTIYSWVRKAIPR